MKYEHNLIVQLGWRATGKTEFCKRVIKHQKPERCLVIDTCHEYSDIPEVDDVFLSMNDLKGTYRVAFGNVPKKDRFETFGKYISKFYNRLLIIEIPACFDDFGDEDAFHKIMMASDLVGAILTKRSHKVDIIINLQSVKHFLHPKIVATANVLILRKTIESVYIHREMIPSESLLETLMEAEQTIRDTFVEYVAINLDNQ